MADLKSKFEELLLSTKREGIEELIASIRKTDFYTAPASTRFHSCHEGGLLEHSLNVYRCLTDKKISPIWGEVLKEVPDASIILVALLHDLCKANFYGTELKNKKIYSEHGSKIDSNGRYDWQTVPTYTIDDKLPLGHGEKSIMMAERFIRLTTEERYAIRWHMGFTEPKENWNYFTSAVKVCPLVLAIHEADIEATYLLEEEE